MSGLPPKAAVERTSVDVSNVPIRDIVKQIEISSFALILTLPYDRAMKRFRHKQCSIHLGFLDSVAAETGLAVG
jgi:hypothetical protein